MTARSAWRRARGAITRRGLVVAASLIGLLAVGRLVEPLALRVDDELRVADAHLPWRLYTEADGIQGQVWMRDMAVRATARDPWGRPWRNRLLPTGVKRLRAGQSWTVGVVSPWLTSVDPEAEVWGRDLTSWQPAPAGCLYLWYSSGPDGADDLAVRDSDDVPLFMRSFDRLVVLDSLPVELSWLTALTLGITWSLGRSTARWARWRQAILVVPSTLAGAAWLVARAGPGVVESLALFVDLPAADAIALHVSGEVAATATLAGVLGLVCITARLSTPARAGLELSMSVEGKA